MTDAETGDVQTPGGRMLSEAEFEALADEAERGYAFELGGRYRDNSTGHHVLMLYGPSNLADLPDAEWGYIVTSQPDGTLSEDMGAIRWTAHDGERYAALSLDVGVVLAELRNLVALLADEVDPAGDEDGEWDADRLPAVAFGVATLFEKLDSHLQDGGSLPLEWETPQG